MPDATPIDDGGPAFPFPSGPEPRVDSFHDRCEGMTLRQWAAVTLCVPSSGTPWLDAMIREARQHATTAQLMAGLYASGATMALDGKTVETAEQRADYAAAVADHIALLAAKAAPRFAGAPKALERMGLVEIVSDTPDRVVARRVTKEAPRG